MKKYLFALSVVLVLCGCATQTPTPEVPTATVTTVSVKPTSSQPEPTSTSEPTKTQESTPTATPEPTATPDITYVTMVEVPKPDWLNLTHIGNDQWNLTWTDIDGYPAAFQFHLDGEVCEAWNFEGDHTLIVAIDSGYIRRAAVLVPNGSVIGLIGFGDSRVQKAYVISDGKTLTFLKGQHSPAYFRSAVNLRSHIFETEQMNYQNLVDIEDWSPDTYLQRDWADQYAFEGEIHIQNPAIVVGELYGLIP